MDDDASLVEAIHAGEVGAFEVLYRHVGAVAMVARDQVRDPDQIAEVVQETFARALESLPRLESGDRFRPSLLAIASHAAVDARRGNAQLRPELLDTVDGIATTEPQELAEIAELVALVRGAVTGLSKRDATALALVAVGFEAARGALI